MYALHNFLIQLISPPCGVLTCYLSSLFTALLQETLPLLDKVDLHIGENHGIALYLSLFC